MLRGLLVALVVSGCRTEPPPPGPATAEPVPTVVPGLAGIGDHTARPRAAPATSAGGGFRISDGPALHGDPAACEAFRACCGPHDGQVTPPGLACGLAPAAGDGDCARALESVRGVFREQGLPACP